MYLVSAAAMACLALALSNVNCGGGGSGESPTGSGGAGGSTGGTTGGGNGGSGGAGGTTTATTTTPSGLDCSNAVVPANKGDNGFITDFSDYSTTSGKFGDAVQGAPYAYGEQGKSTMSYKVDTTIPALTGTGSVADNSYGGIGFSYAVCTTVASFSKIQFTLQGTWPGCDLELQIKTFDQTPTTQSPAGSCESSCYNFPVAKQISTGSETPQDIAINLADLTKWSAANAGQVIGLQWQFTGTTVDPDAGAGCPITFSVTNIRFVP
jgi:hypothetical protein